MIKLEENKITDAFSLFSLIKENVQQLFIRGVISINAEKKRELAEVSVKFRKLGLVEISKRIDNFLAHKVNPQIVNNLLQLMTLSRLMERLYTKEVLLTRLREVE